MKRLALPLFILSLGFAPSLSANPYTLQYGGRLISNVGRPLSGPLALTVNFYNTASSNSLLATQSFASVALQDGLFHLNINLSPANFETVFASPEVWIEVVDNTNGKTYPRQKFGAVPYAFKVPTDGLTLGYDANGKMRVQGLGPAALPSGNPSDGQILKWKDGTGWEWGADNTGGASGSVDSAAILDASITDADVAASAAIAGSKISPNFGAQNITTTGTISGDGSGLTNLPAGPLGASIDGSEIASGSISNTHIAAGAAIAQSKIDGLSTALAAREGTVTAGTAGQYYKGDKTWATLDTAAVPENSNLYYTDARARGALSAAAPLSYNSATGAMTITAASGISAGTISAAEFLSFSAKQAAITAASTVNTGTMTTALQMGVEINPYGTNAGESGELRFKELAASGANYVGFKAPDTLASDKVYVLPAIDGSVGQFLSTDGSGNLSWGSVGGAAGGTVTSITAGTGLSGGTITGSGTINLANTAVTPGSYTRSNITVDAQGRVTAAANGSSVNLTSEVTGALPLANGGTGATTAGDARTALGLGGLATQSSVNLASETTGTLALASGGTGATTAATARTSLGLGGLATLSAVGSTEITDASIANADIAAAAGIVDSKLDTISTAGKVSNSATTATSANTASAIVARDPSGDFSAGTITATLIGNASTATSAGSVSGTVAIANGGTGATTAALARTALGLGALATENSVDLATSTSGSLSISSGGTGATTAGAARTNLGLGGLAILSAVGAGEITDDSIGNADISASAGIADSKLATISSSGKVSNSATTATNLNTNNAIVARDGSGNFSAGTITANLSGNATTATTAGSLSGTVAIPNGGTGATTAALARSGLGAAALGANTDITSLGGLTTAISTAQGGTGSTSTPSNGQLLIGNGTGYTTATLSQGANAGVTIANGAGTVTLDTAQDVRTTASPSFSNLTLSGMQKMAKNSAPPVVCNAGNDSYIAMTTDYYTCVCRGSTSFWVATSDGKSGCTWGNSQTFSYTGSVQSFTVPAGVTQINIKAWGAGGGGRYSEDHMGGAGGFAGASFSVTPGDVFSVYVGGGGASGIASGLGGQGGYGGGGGGGYYAGGGGGRTSIVRNSGTVTYLVAGGGGGAGPAQGGGAATRGGGSGGFPGKVSGTGGIGGSSSYVGGNAGSWGSGAQGSGGHGYGATGVRGLGGTSAAAGSSGSEGAGGGAGAGFGGGGGGGTNTTTSAINATAGTGTGGGSPGTGIGAGGGGGGGGGGAGGASAGGGGGGGYGGGGGAGSSSGGGGGSSYLNSTFVFSSGVTFPGSGASVFNLYDPNYVEGIGSGGLAPANGGHGYVLISW